MGAKMHRVDINISSTIKENASNSARTEFLKALSTLTDLSLKKNGIMCTIRKHEYPVNRDNKVEIGGKNENC